MEIDEAVGKFLSSAAAERNLSRATIRAYAGDLRLFKRKVRTQDVTALSTDDLRDFIEGLEKSQAYQDTTIRRRLATLKVFFSFLESEGALQASPARRLRGRYAI